MNENLSNAGRTAAGFIQRFFSFLLSIFSPKTILLTIASLIIAIVGYSLLKGVVVQFYYDHFKSAEKNISYEEIAAEYSSDRDWIKCIFAKADNSKVDECYTKLQGKPEWFLCVYDSIPSEESRKCDERKK